MISRRRNLMSLEQFAELALLDPFHVAGYCVDDKDEGCDCTRQSFPEFAYQGKFLSRFEVSKAIETAEEMIARELRYWTAPVAFVNEEHPYPQAKHIRSHKNSPNMARRSMITRDGKDYKGIHLEWGFIQDIGIWADTSQDETDTLVLNAAKTRFTATLTWSPAFALTGAEEFLIYFTDSDIRDGDELEDWRVRDVNTSIVDNGGGSYTLTITGGAYLLMPDANRDVRRWECVDGDAAASFVTELQVYTRLVDNTIHGSLQWGNNPCLNGCNDLEIDGVCLQRDDEVTYPIVRPKPQNYNIATSTWDTYCPKDIPTWVMANYIAGVPRVNGKVKSEYAMATFLLASSLLETDAANCNCAPSASERLSKYRDVEKTDVRREDFATGLAVTADKILAQTGQIASQWGARYGAVLSWNMIQSIKQRDYRSYHD